MSTVKDINPIGYGRVYKSMVCNPDLSPPAKAVYAYLAAYAGESDSAFPGPKRYKTEMGMSVKTFKKYIKELKEAGYVIVETRLRDDGSFASNNYILTDPSNKKVEDSDASFYPTPTPQLPGTRPVRPSSPTPQLPGTRPVGMRHEEEQLQVTQEEEHLRNNTASWPPKGGSARFDSSFSGQETAGAQTSELDEPDARQSPPAIELKVSKRITDRPKNWTQEHEDRLAKIYDAYDHNVETKKNIAAFSRVAEKDMNVLRTGLNLYLMRTRGDSEPEDKANFKPLRKALHRFINNKCYLEELDRLSF